MPVITAVPSAQGSTTRVSCDGCDRGVTLMTVTGSVVRRMVERIEAGHSCDGRS